jgi:hypothetical protein
MPHHHAAIPSGNVFFNGPRAGININDGFAGGHVMKRNVGFNLVRETSDHGVFNSWDRNTYVRVRVRVRAHALIFSSLARDACVCPQRAHTC